MRKTVLLLGMALIASSAMMGQVKPEYGSGNNK